LIQFLLSRISPSALPDGATIVSTTVFAVAGYAVFAVVLEVARRTMAHRRMELARATLGVELAASRRRRTEAELHALKAELNPHFLGNALASVGALLESDPVAAQRTLGQVGAMLGRLGRRGAHELTLDEELEGLEPVLEYERLRLAGNLRVVRDIARGAGEALVPDMILHPLVENAVKYGLAPHGGGTLRVTARRGGRSGTELVLSIGHGCPEDAAPVGAVPPGTGIGLSNVRARLQELYGAAARLELCTAAPHCIEARLTLPWRDENSPGAVPMSAGATRLDDEELPSNMPGSPGHGTPEAAVAPPMAGSPRRSWRIALVRIGVMVAGWAALAALAYSGRIRTGEVLQFPVEPAGALASAMVSATLRLAAVVIAIMLMRRLASRAASKQALSLHLRTGLTFGVATALLQLTAVVLADPAAGAAITSSLVLFHVAMRMMSETMFHLAVIGIYQAQAAMRRARWTQGSRLRLQLRLEEERHRAASAELRTLQAELNPHFIGNALGVVSSLVHTDRAAALRVLADLGVLLRGAVSRTRSHEVTLREELVTLRSFIAVEHARMGRPLDIRWSVQETALDRRVPQMILQPLLENAVKHGLGHRARAGRIDVEAHCTDRELQLVVRDDGVGFTPGDGSGTADGRRGVGLTNTRARLSGLYGPQAGLELSRGESGGTVARVRIPSRDAGSPGLDFAAD
ncbi:MAG: histidine kinase, partial [Gemmatimonadaceae bacterium]|nr:histidine kinase [Gemmatimonadaceae bacterium]